MGTWRQVLKLLFTPYFVGLTVCCGMILSFVYPKILADDRFPVEYKIGKYAGYLYIGGSLLMWFITALFT